MRTYRGLTQYPADAPPCVVAQGTFDGLHVGHQEVIRLALERGRARSLPVVALTFDPNPASVLRPREAPPEIFPLEERLAQIAAVGADITLVIPFTEAFSRVEATSFVRDVLAGHLRAREVVVGFNHTFGRGARGTPAFLAEMAEPLGIRVHVVPPKTVNGVIASATSVREALRRGDVGTVADLLGRPYTIRGCVSRGAERGRTLGFPTANLVPAAPLLLATGVYAARAVWAGHSAPAVANVGVRPTFGGSTVVIEAHLLDTHEDLYGVDLSVAFLARIRDEMRFASVESLRARIEEDVRAARSLLGV